MLLLAQSMMIFILFGNLEKVDLPQFCMVFHKNGISIGHHLVLKAMILAKKRRMKILALNYLFAGGAFHPRSACHEIVILPSLKQNANLGGRPRRKSSLGPLQLLLLHPLLSFFLLSPYTHYIS